MRVLNRSVYVGPSLYAHFPVIRLELDLGALEAWPTAKLGTALVDTLIEALPGLAEHGCTYREPCGFVRRMPEGEGTGLSHALEHVADARTPLAHTAEIRGVNRCVMPGRTQW